MGFPDDVSKMFQAESEKLDGLMGVAAASELSIHEIVETYYQIINVSSMIAMLKQQLTPNDSSPLLEKISETEKKISGKFNSEIHPKILTGLTASVAEATNKLRAPDSDGTSQKEDGDKSAAYEELRQKMSAREFVEQYDKGLK